MNMYVCMHACMCVCMCVHTDTDLSFLKGNEKRGSSSMTCLNFYYFNYYQCYHYHYCCWMRLLPKTIVSFATRLLLCPTISLLTAAACSLAWIDRIDWPVPVPEVVPTPRRPSKAVLCCTDFSLSVCISLKSVLNAGSIEGHEVMRPLCREDKASSKALLLSLTICCSSSSSCCCICCALRWIEEKWNVVTVGKWNNGVFWMGEIMKMVV